MTAIERAEAALAETPSYTNLHPDQEDECIVAVVRLRTALAALVEEARAREQEPTECRDKLGPKPPSRSRERRRNEPVRWSFS